MASAEIAVRSSIKGVGRVPAFIQEFCRNNGVGQSVAANLCVVLDEVLPGLVGITTSPRILLELVRTEQAIQVSITHDSEAYDLSAGKPMVWPEGALEFRISELSLKIIHGLLDGLEHRCENGRSTTVLTLALKR